MAPRTPRVVLLVGASSGIGRAVAHLLAGQGDHLVLASRGRRALDAVVAECRARGAGSVRAVALDVRDADQVERAVQGVVGEHGRLDAAVTTAAVLAFGRFEDVPVAVFDEVVRTDVLGTANVARAVLPVLRGQRSGTLVLTGSVLGEAAVPGMTPYVISKWAVRSLARQLQIENRDVEGVRVCLVSPGSVDTPIYELAANYQGKAARPPFPVSSPERVALAVAAALDHPRNRVGVGPANLVLRVGFALVPRAYDALVGPLYRLLGVGRLPVPPTVGNVLTPTEDLEGVHGDSQLIGTGGR